eukprot:10580-Amphidinium_carterae.1
MGAGAVASIIQVPTYCVDEPVLLDSASCVHSRGWDPTTTSTVFVQNCWGSKNDLEHVDAGVLTLGAGSASLHGTKDLLLLGPPETHPKIEHPNKE